jgi:medium-chain acyl-[acyl-carrier-protein] hydrolase
MPQEILYNPDLMRIALPALKADASLYRKYIYQPGDPLPIPIHAYGGINDPNITKEHLERWQEQTTAEFTLQQFEGGHFFLEKLTWSSLFRLP